MKKKQKSASKAQIQWLEDAEHLFLLIVHDLGEPEARRIFEQAIVLGCAPNMTRTEKLFYWRDFKATDYVPRETDDEPKRSRTSLKAR